MRVLIACEFSGVVRDAFRAGGHNAISCDLLPSEAPGPHIVSDVLGILEQDWDLLIAHPPCTYLSVSGMHWTSRGHRDPTLTESAILFTERLWQAPIKHICIENPIGVLSTRSSLGVPAQVIQPYQFGEDASKATCLWLKNLPKLVPTSPGFMPRFVGKRMRWSNQTDSGQNRLAPGERRGAMP